MVDCLLRLKSLGRPTALRVISTNIIYCSSLATMWFPVEEVYLGSIRGVSHMRTFSFTLQVFPYLEKILCEIGDCCLWRGESCVYDVVFQIQDCSFGSSYRSSSRFVHVSHSYLSQHFLHYYSRTIIQGTPSKDCWNFHPVNLCSVSSEFAFHKQENTLMNW